MNKAKKKRVFSESQEKLNALLNELVAAGEYGNTYRHIMIEVERHLLEVSILAANHDEYRCARRLGISRKALSKKLSKHKIGTYSLTNDSEAA